MHTLIVGAITPAHERVRQAVLARADDVRYVADATEAWATLVDAEPRLVVLAELGPEMLALCHRIRKSRFGDVTTILAIFDDPSASSLNAFVEAGGDDYLLATLEEVRLEARLEFVERQARARLQRKVAENELAIRSRQQARVAELGRRALAGADLQDLFDLGAKITADGLSVPLAIIVEEPPDATGFEVRGSVGWDGERAEQYVPLRAPIWKETLQRGEAIVFEDFDVEGEKGTAPLLEERGVVSGALVAVVGDGEPIGILGAFTTVTRTFAPQDVSFLQTVANVLAEAINRKRSEAALRESEARARAIVETTVDPIITIDTRGHVESFNSAAEKVFGFEAAEVIGRNVSMLMPPPYRDEHDEYIARYRRTGRPQIIGIGREVVGRRKDGSVFPMDLAVSEVNLGGRVIFTGIVRDITERRRLEQEILEISEQERRRIGQDLHDGLGQMLTGIGLIGQNLARKLKANGMPGADEVSEITGMVKEADQFARTLARGLIPVELEANGLAAALQRLCMQAERLFDITCRFEKEREVLLRDNTAAVHLYRICQEAVSNAVKHGKASQVTIRLDAVEGEMTLSIEDDGVGFPDELGEDRGMGVRIMHYRARIIGAMLDIEAEAGAGTRIVCTMPLGRRRARAEDSHTSHQEATL